MPVRRVVIHAGMHKTGTSFVQNTLYENRDYLRECGILYPISGLHRRSSAAGLRHLGLRMSLGEEGASSYALEVLRDELRASDCHTAIISYEGFLAPDFDLSLLTDGLADYEMILVLYLRNPADYIESKYREWVRLNNYAGEIQRFYASHSGYLDYAGLLDRAASTRPDARVVVRSVELLADQDRLVSDLLLAADVTQRTLALPPTSRRNDRWSNSLTLTKLMANKLYFAGDVDARSIVAGSPYEYASNEGRLMDDATVEHVRRHEWPEFLQLLEQHDLDPTRLVDPWANRERDDAFFDPEVRHEALRHVRELHSRRAASDAARRQQAQKLAARHDELVAEVREKNERVGSIRAELERTRDELRAAREAERQLRRLRSRVDLLRFWRPRNWRRYSAYCLRRVGRGRRRR